MSEDVSNETAARAKCRRAAYLKIDVPGVGAIDQDY
jgi:hypothetical protein